MSEQSWEEQREQRRLWEERMKERPEKIGIASPHVDFKPTDVNLFVADKYQDQLALLYRVQLMPEWLTLPTGEKEYLGESVTLSTGGKVGDLVTNIRVLAENDRLKNKDDQKGVGSICYVPAFDDSFGFGHPACCSVEVFVPKVTFDELLAAARLGRLPADISIEVEGMQYDWQPDGKHKKWDNKAFPKLNVTSVSFGAIPLVAQIMRSDFDGDLSDQFFPPTRLQVKELSEKLDDLSIGLSKALWWLFVIGVLMLIFTIRR